jgi:ABC-type amino acid transport substrate-binding protein
MLFCFFFRRYVIFLLLFGLSPLALADKSNSKEMVCLTTHYPPYTIYRDRQRDFVGRDMVYLNQLASRFNWKLTVLNVPWARVKREIEKDQFDCFFSLAYQEQRAKYLSYTQHPLHVTKYGVFFQKHNVSIKQKQLAKKIIGVQRGIPLTIDVLKNHQLDRARIVYLDSNETLLSIIMTGRVDASVLNYDVGHFLLQDSPFKSEIGSFVIDDYDLPVFLAFRKGTQDIKLINTVLGQVMADSQIAKPLQ